MFLKLSVLYRITFLTLLVYFAMPFLLSAQDNDLIAFKRIYQYELSENDSLKSLRKEQFSVGVSELPVWFWGIPLSDGKTRYAIGISDPVMKDTIQARRMAIDRALIQLGLMDGVKFTGVSDLYDKNLQNKYEELYKMEGSLILKGSYMIADSFTTRYGEKMYLLKYQSQGQGNTKLDIVMQTYKSNTKIDIGWCVSEKTEYILKTDKTDYYYAFMEDDNRSELVSLCNSDTIPAYRYMYEYTTTSPSNTHKDSELILKLYGKGLWWGYLKALSNNLQLMIANKRSKIKSMDELKGNKNGSVINNSLLRSIVNDNIRFTISGISTMYGQININISAINQ